MRSGLPTEVPPYFWTMSMGGVRRWEIGDGRWEMDWPRRNAESTKRRTPHPGPLPNPLPIARLHPTSARQGWGEGEGTTGTPPSLYAIFAFFRGYSSFKILDAQHDWFASDHR